MKIAIVGTGISGLISAYLLNSIHEVTLFEAESWIGGHTHTVPVTFEEDVHWVDTGFIVFNDKNYNNLNKLFNLLSIPVQDSCMSFSVTCEKTGLVYSGSNLNGFFAQRRNIVEPSFYKFFYEIQRFRVLSLKFLSNKQDSSETLNEFLSKNKFSDFFVKKYLIPMLSAIWSNPKEKILDTNVVFFMNFLNNHGMLSITGRPVWKTVVGGSHVYVNKMTIPFRSKIYLQHKVTQVVLNKNSVTVNCESRNRIEEMKFDKVILAVHSDQAIKLIKDPEDLVQRTVGKIEYQKNEVVLHCDERCLPPVRRAHASWNYVIPKNESNKPILTYNMNKLQNISSKKPLLVSLNSEKYIDPKKIIEKFSYSHPIFNKDIINIQKQFNEVNTPENRIFFCGAYWGNGFHEDGLNSGIEVAKRLGGKWG